MGGWERKRGKEKLGGVRGLGKKQDNVFGLGHGGMREWRDGGEGTLGWGRFLSSGDALPLRPGGSYTDVFSLRKFMAINT